MKQTSVLLLILLLASFTTADISTNLVAHWTFDETAGTTASDSAGTAHGTLSGFIDPDAAWTDGTLGGALELNGSTESVSVPGIAGSSACDEITISAWIRLDNLTGFKAIFNHDTWTNGSVHFQIYNNMLGMAVCGVEHLDQVVAFSDMPYEWYHVVCVYSNSNKQGRMASYVNGEELHSEIVTQASTINLARAAGIGAWNTSRYFDGTIDDVRIYDRALSAAEIGKLYDPKACLNKGDYQSDGIGIAQAKQFYRMSFWRAPQNASADCLADLAWKHGPAIYGTYNKWGDPVFYQLMRDYTIDLSSYFADHTKLPHYKDFTSVISQKPWKWHLDTPVWQLILLNHVSFSPRLLAVDSRHVKVWTLADVTFPPFGQRTMMTIKKGYRWDGPSLSWDGTAGTKRIAAKASASMRASLVHDAFYDMMRTGSIIHDVATPIRPLPEANEIEGFYNRAVADCMFYMLLIQDGYEGGKALSNFGTIREFGRTKTWPNNLETYPSWKTAAIADAGPDQYIDCAPVTGVDVTLDGSGSKFATTLNWTIGRTDSPDLRIVASGINPTIHLEPGIHTISVNAHEAGPIAPAGYWDMDAVVITVSTDGKCIEYNGDIDGDGDVDLTDFTLLAEDWLAGT